MAQALDRCLKRIYAPAAASPRPYIPLGRDLLTHRPWRPGAVLTALAVVLVLVVGSQAGAAPSIGRYIVQLSDPPLASYRGGVTGLQATNPSALGKTRLDVSSPASQAYLSYLDKQQASFRTPLTQALGRTVTVPFSYRYAFNGIAAILNSSEAATVAAMPGVANVERE